MQEDATQPLHALESCWQMRDALISGVGFTTVQHAFSHFGQLLWTSADLTNSPLSSGGRFIAAMVRLIRPDVIDTHTSNRQSPQLAHGQLRELFPWRQCKWCFLRGFDVLTEHERQRLWVQELTTNQLLKWQEVCKSIARWADSGQVAIQRHFVLVPRPSPDLSAKLAYIVYVWRLANRNSESRKLEIGVQVWCCKHSGFPVEHSSSDEYTSAELTCDCWRWCSDACFVNERKEQDWATPRNTPVSSRHGRGR